jgi:ribulose kinase
MNKNENYVIGTDFGTDSVRTLIVDAAIETGIESIPGTADPG